ncbi:hypothetical protein SCHPADRAFT_944102 [Schizopora paradoxa]|uniref:C2H2-type domain-containing protein n=1 Tax=Schizopora paradoxa TaxID=27342 RepID=A0A0H2RAK8_9AGAM|nr:hypothetical protein SCHPADRAFT_944102 [Schizopora paradoxa]
MNSNLDCAFIEWCLSQPVEVLWNILVECERVLGSRGSTGTRVDPPVSVSLLFCGACTIISYYLYPISSLHAPQETKAEELEGSFGVLPTLPHEVAGITATPIAPLPQATAVQHQQIGHYDTAYNDNDIVFDNSVDDYTMVHDGQFDDFNDDVAEDVKDTQAAAGSSVFVPPANGGEAARDEEGFLDPNVVLPVAHRAAGSSNTSFKTHFERSSQSPTPSSSRSSSVVSSRPPSATPSFSNGNPSGRNNIRSLSPTPPLTRSGSVVSTRSQNLTTPSPVATPQVLDGHCYPHAHGNFGHTAPIVSPPWGPVAGPSVHPTYYKAQQVPGYGHFPNAPPYTPGSVSQLAARWQQGISQPVPQAHMHGQYNAQAHRVGQGNVAVQHNVYAQQTPNMLQRVQVQQTAKPRAPTKGKTKSSNPRVKRSPAHATSKTDVLGGPVVEKPKKLYACPDCGKTFDHPRTRDKHYHSVCLKERWFCPKSDCKYSMFAKQKPGTLLGICRRDSLERHVRKKHDPDWHGKFRVMYP